MLIAVALLVLAHPSRAPDVGTGMLGVGIALAIGALIGTYTLWDAHAVQALAVPPLLQDWAASAGRLVLLSPPVWARRAEVARVGQHFARGVLWAGLLIPLPYVLVLYALRLAPVTGVAPVREVSVIVGVLFGGRLLAEADLRRRLLGAALVFAGALAVAVA